MIDYDNEEKAIVTNDELINKQTRAVPVPNQKKDIDADKDFLDSLVQAAVKSQLDLNLLNSFTNVSQNREQLYTTIDSMCEDSTISAILETYAEDATEYNENGDIIWAASDDANVAKYITFLLESMQVNKNAYEWVLSLCKYGDLYLQLYRESEYQQDLFFNKDKNKKKKSDNKLNEDVKIAAYKDTDKYVHYIEMVSNPAKMFELTKFGKTCGFIEADTNLINANKNKNFNVQNVFKYNFAKKDVIMYDATKFAHAILTDNVDRHPEEVNIFLDKKSMENNNTSNSSNYKVKSGQSILYNTFKIWRELSLLENSMLLNRITKSSIIRLINVEVGDMPKEQVGPYLQRIKSLMEQKAAIDPGVGMQEYTNPGPIENNIYVPTHNGQGAITTGQIGGDVNVGQLPDIEYFQNKFFGAMRIPKQYFGLTDDGAGFNGGQSLAIISSRYAKMIKRIQNALIQAITNAVNLMLLDKGLNSYIGKFTIKMQPPTTQEEIDRRDNLSSRIAIVSDIMNLVSDIEDPAARLKILKSLISNVVDDEDIVAVIQDEIDKLEDELNNNSNNNDDADLLDDIESSSSGNSDLGLDLDSELGLDNDLNLDDNINTDDNLENDSEETLPTPEELGLDLTDTDNFEA